MGACHDYLETRFARLIAIADNRVKAERKGHAQSEAAKKAIHRQVG